MQYILNNDLGLKLLKFRKVQELTDRQKKVRLERAKELLCWNESGQLPNLVFSGEKPFRIEQFVYKQNDRVYLPNRSAENLHLRLATRTQAAPMVMVCLCTRIPRSWCQNKCQILSGKCLKDSIEDLGRQTFRQHSNSTQYHRSLHVSTKNGFKKRFLASFLPPNLRILNR